MKNTKNNRKNGMNTIRRLFFASRLQPILCGRVTEDYHTQYRIKIQKKKKRQEITKE